MKEGLRELKRAQKQEISVVYEISQPKIGPCENSHLLRNNFAAQDPPMRNQGFAVKKALRCEIISQPKPYPLRNTPLARECHFAAPQPHFAAAKWAAKPPAKFPFGCKIPSKLRNGLRNPPLAAKSPFCCEMASKLRNGCEITSKLQNGLQVAKLTCEREEGLQKHLAKPKKVAKMPTEPRDHASEEESPAHPGITHTKPLTPFLTSVNHQSP